MMRVAIIPLAVAVVVACERGVDSGDHSARATSSGESAGRVPTAPFVSSAS